MAKSKLLTIPIEEDKRDRLNQYCADRGMTVSQLITKHIDSCLDGSIDPSTSIEPSIPYIDIDSIVEKAIDKIVPLMMNKIHDIEQNVMDKTKENETDIFDLTNEMINHRKYINRVTDLLKSKGMNDLSEVTIPKSSLIVEKPPKQPAEPTTLNDTYLPESELTLDDTRKYIESRFEYNRSCKKRLDRDSNQKIADFLQENDYPHPDNKKWHRNHISEVCKLWRIDTK